MLKPAETKTYFSFKIKLCISAEFLACVALSYVIFFQLNAVFKRNIGKHTPVCAIKVIAVFLNLFLESIKKNVYALFRKLG